MKRAAVAAAAVLAAIAAILAVKCSGSSREAASTKVSTSGATGATASRAAREEKPDPRTVARVAIHGVISEKGGGPLAGAQVCANGRIEHVPEDETRDPKCALTDPQGRYGFDDLYAGTYWVSASAPHHIPNMFAGPKPDKVSSLVLAPGQRRDDIDIALAPGGVEVRGTVADINGGPIAEAWVGVSPGNWYGGRAAATTRSAADGTFTAWVAAGPIDAQASADGYANGSQSGTAPTTHLEILLTPESVLAGTVVEAEGGAPVAGATVSIEPDWESGDYVNGGSATSDDQGRFRITRLAPGRYRPTATSLGRYGEPADSVLLGLGQTVEGVVIPVHAVRVVTGRIVIATEPASATPATPASAKPSEGASNGSGAPSALPGCAHGWLWVQGKTTRRFSASTEADGAVRIDAIVPGTYKVNVHCQGYVEEDEYADLVIAEADATGLEWRVHPGSTITGTVKTRAGAPVAGVYISARTIGGDPRGQRSWSNATSEDDGSFEIPGVFPGDYALEVMTDDHPKPKDPVKVTVVAGTGATVDVVLDDGGTIAGVVVDERGQPVTGARVNAMGDRWEWRGMGERTSDDGSFEVKGLAPGSYRVSASRSWTETMRKPGSTDDDVQGERTTVTAGQTSRVRLVVESQGGVIAGVVVDATGAPVPDAYLATERESDASGALAGSAARQSRWGWDKKPVVTDATGAFKISNLSPATYTVRAYRKGGGEAIAEHVASGTRNARLVMKPTGSLSGTVTLEGGHAPDDVTISVTDVKVGFSRREQLFRTQGAFVLADLPAGTFTVRASAAEGQVETQVTLAEGEHKTGLALQLEARVTVTGRLVTLDDHAPVPGLQVMIAPIKGGSGMMVTYGAQDKQNITDADGKFRVEDAPAGRVFVQAFPIDWEQSTFGFVRVARTLAGGGEVDVGEIKVPRRRVGARDRGGDLGFDLKEQPPDLDPEDAKLEVSRIRPDGPAVGSGLAVGDVIVAVDGTDVSGASSYLAWSLLNVPVGTKVALGLARGATISITTVPEP